MRAITVSELINELLQLKQPHASVLLVAECECECDPPCMKQVTLRVTGVESDHPTNVRLVTEEHVP